MRRILVAWAALAAARAHAAPSDVPVRVYADGNGSSLTDLVQGLDLNDRPLAGVLVDLFGGGGTHLVSTDAEGRALFDGLEDGLYLLRPLVEGDPACTSRNAAAHLAGLLAAGVGRAVSVALGDSTPVQGVARPYPARLGRRSRPCSRRPRPATSPTRGAPPGTGFRGTGPSRERGRGSARRT